MSNIARILLDTSDRVPDHPAVETGASHVDYHTLARRAGGFASAFRDVGVRPGDRVAILLERGSDAAAAFYGAAALGAVAINVNETLRPRQIEHILRHADARVFVSNNRMLSRQPRPIDLGPTRAVGADEVPAHVDLDIVPRDDTDVAQIIYTSGSTGLPKGVVISHANLRAGIDAVTTYLDLDPSDRLASLLPFSFDYGFNQLLSSVAVGATLVVDHSPIPARIVANLRKRDVTVLAAVPPLWLQLLTAASFRSEAIPTLRTMTNTGGRVPEEAVRQLRAAQPQARLFLMYGLTEAFRSTYLPPDELDRRVGSIGHAIPGATILVLNEHGEECAPHEPGELVHRGPTVALGYWNDPESTSTVFKPDPAHGDDPAAPPVVYSGDLVKRDEDGFLYFVGRRDHMIKTLGYRVSPDEVSDALFSSGEATEVVITADPDEHLGSRIVAHVVLSPDGSLERLEAFSRAELPRYMQPASIVVHDSLPRTASGKHDPKALADRS